MYDRYDFVPIINSIAFLVTIAGNGTAVNAVSNGQSMFIPVAFNLTNTWWTEQENFEKRSL